MLDTHQVLPLAQRRVLSVESGEANALVALLPPVPPRLLGCSFRPTLPRVEHASGSFIAQRRVLSVESGEANALVALLPPVTPSSAEVFVSLNSSACWTRIRFFHRSAQSAERRWRSECPYWHFPYPPRLLGCSFASTLPRVGHALGSFIAQRRC